MKARASDAAPADAAPRAALRDAFHRAAAGDPDHAALLAGDVADIAARYEGLLAPGARRSGGVWYTPAHVVEHLLDAALEPILDRTPASRLLELRVCDPACGAGTFLAAAARRIARRLPDGAFADVVATCLVGADLDDVALEVAALAFARAGAPRPPRLLHGHALLAAPAGPLALGDVAFEPLPGEDRATNTRLRRLARAAPPPPSVAPSRAAMDTWCAAHLQVRGGGDEIGPVELAAVLAGAPPPPSVAATLAELPPVQWAAEAPDGLDLVVGNPPFLNQLERGTWHTRAVARLLRALYGEAAAAYTDAATLFWLLGLRLARPGGRVALISPQSLLAAKDAAPTRRALATGGSLRGLWVAGEPVFSAEVHVCAPVVERDGPRDVVTARWRGAAWAPAAPLPLDMDTLAEAPTWAPVAADLFGVPRVVSRSRGTLADLARATADFRDEFYGLAPHVLDLRDADDAAFPRLLTAGLIDPLHARWGELPTRFARRPFLHPRVDLAAVLEGPLAAWARARLVPKVLLAVQTRVLEAFVDADGRWLATTPVVVVIPAPEHLWRVAAVLCAPQVTAWALEHYGGAALNADAVKLSAAQVGRIPLPADEYAWDDAAALLAEGGAAALDAAALRMAEAYGAPMEPVTGWWRTRRPVRAV